MLKKSTSQEPLDQFQPNLDGNMPGGWGIQCSNKGAGPFWGPIRGKVRKILINLQKSSSHEPLTGRNTLMFSMEHPWGKEIQGSNKVPRVTYGPTPGP